MTLATEDWELHCQQIAALLLAGDVQARAVHPIGTVGVEVYSEDKKTRVVWSPANDQHWGWIMVLPDGSVETSETPLRLDAAVEDVARAIATMFTLVDLPPL